MKLMKKQIERLWNALKKTTGEMQKFLEVTSLQEPGKKKSKLPVS